MQSRPIFFKKLKSSSFLESARYFDSDIKISGADRKIFTVSKIVQKKIRFYTRNGAFFRIDKFFVIDGLSSDLNISKMSMLSLDLKCHFKDDFVEIKGLKVPLIRSGRKTNFCKSKEPNKN